MSNTFDRGTTRRHSQWARRLHFVVAGALALAAGGAAAAVPAAADGPTTFSNTAAIAVPAGGSVGPASPYPSTLSVSGLAGTITTVTVSLNGLSHSTVNDVDAMLVSPTGANLVFLSDVGDPQNAAFANNGTLTFSDTAANQVSPGNIPTGSYLPTNNGAGDAFPAPAPSPSSQTTLGGAFAGSNPNGSWRLYIVDDTSGDVGQVAGGWSLTITTAATSAATTTALASSTNPSAHGQAVTFTATVTAGSNPVTTGSVQFADGGTVLASSVAVNASGTATLTTSTLAPGTHTISATYSGATGFLTSSGTLSQAVDKASTTTTIASNLNPSSYGQFVTFTATVTSGGGPVTDGSVQFSEGGSPLGAAVIVSADGTASLTTSELMSFLIPHTIVATYSGTPGLAGSTASVDQWVDPAPTTLNLTSSSNPSIVGQPVTYTATLSSGGAPVPYGSIEFGGDPSVEASVMLAADGTASLTTAALPPGSTTVTASYFPTQNLDAAATTLVQEVLPGADAGGPYTVAEGAPLTLDAYGSSPGATIGWDLNGDGDFTDATGRAPTLSWADLEALGVDDGPTTGFVRSRATLGTGVAVTSSPTMLTVTNTAPDAVVPSGLTATVGSPFTVKVGARDPSSADMAGTFTYTVDWGDGSPVQTVTGPADPPVTHTYTAAGSVSASFTATDGDGGTGAATTVTVVVATADVPDGDSLAHTGADVGLGILGPAGTLVLVGFVLILLARARSDSRGA